jgi:hypothetical protein
MGLDSRSIASSGGAVDVTASEPQDPTDGDIWMEPDGTVRVYDQSGGRWVRPDLITRTDDAQTFGESDVSVTATNAIKNGNGYDLAGEQTAGSDGGSYENAVSSTTVDIEAAGDYLGVYVTAVRAQIRSSGGGSVTVTIKDSGGNTIAQGSGSTGSQYSDASVSFTESDYSDLLDPGESGQIVVDAGSDTMATDNGAADAGAIVTATAGDQPYSNDTSTAYAAAGVPESGDVIVSWPAPDGIRSWDVIGYNAVPDGGTVTANVLDGSGTVLVNDAADGADISDVSAGTNVEVQAELVRSAASETPRLEYAARRYRP